MVFLGHLKGQTHLDIFLEDMHVERSNWCHFVTTPKVNHQQPKPAGSAVHLSSDRWQPMTFPVKNTVSRKPKTPVKPQSGSSNMSSQEKRKEKKEGADNLAALAEVCTRFLAKMAAVEQVCIVG